jgi:general secretion pathway protein M
MIRVNPREKKILIAGGCVLAALFVYLLVVSPYMDALETLDGKIESEEKRLQDVLTKQAEYLSLKENTGILEKMVRSTPGFSLLSFLESLAQKNKMKQKIAYMKPLNTPGNERYRESSVEMKVERITLKQLVDFLYAVEQARQPIRIKRLNIGKKKEETYLNVTLQASIFEPAGPDTGPGTGKAETPRRGQPSRRSQPAARRTAPP